MKRSDSDAQRLIATLRRHLKSQGITSARIARELSISEPTAKRWLAGKALTLDRLERLAQLCGHTLSDLARESERPSDGLAQELTLAQEQALLSDEFLALMFFTILSGSPPEETATDFLLPPRMVEAALIRLERLALIDRLPGGRVRARVDRTVIWRKAPMRALFEARMKVQFTTIDYSAPETVYASEMVKLSPKGIAALGELIEEFRRNVQAITRHDRDTAHLPGQWIATLAVMRTLDLSGLDRLRP